jgi:hypothetical protein
MAVDPAGQQSAPDALAAPLLERPFVSGKQPREPRVVEEALVTEGLDRRLGQLLGDLAALEVAADLADRAVALVEVGVAEVKRLLEALLLRDDAARAQDAMPRARRRPAAPRRARSP